MSRVELDNARHALELDGADLGEGDACGFERVDNLSLTSSSPGLA